MLIFIEVCLQSFQLVIRKLKVLRVSDEPAAIEPSPSAAASAIEDVDDDFDSIVIGAGRASASPPRGPSPAASDVGMAELPGPFGDEADTDTTKKRRKNEKKKETTKGGKK